MRVLVMQGSQRKKSEKGVKRICRPFIKSETYYTLKGIHEEFHFIGHKLVESRGFKGWLFTVVG